MESSRWKIFVSVESGWTCNCSTRWWLFDCTFVSIWPQHVWLTYNIACAAHALCHQVALFSTGAAIIPFTKFFVIWAVTPHCRMIFYSPWTIFILWLTIDKTRQNSTQLSANFPFSSIDLQTNNLVVCSGLTCSACIPCFWWSLL